MNIDWLVAVCPQSAHDGDVEFEDVSFHMWVKCDRKHIPHIYDAASKRRHAWCEHRRKNSHQRTGIGTQEFIREAGFNKVINHIIAMTETLSAEGLPSRTTVVLIGQLVSPMNNASKWAEIMSALGRVILPKASPMCDMNAFLGVSRSSGS